MNKLYIALVLALCFGYPAFAGEIQLNNKAVEEAAQSEASQETVSEVGEIMPEEPYTFPEIKPQTRVYGGYGFTGLTGSPRADEYSFIHDSVVLGGELRLLPFPHRFHLVADALNRKDYFWDMSYAYEDMVIFRTINRTLFHNLDNLAPVDLNTANSDYRVNVLDKDVKYGTKFGMNTFSLRFKTHDFPFHVYLDGSLIDRDGTQQQHSFLKGSSSPRSGFRTSEQRDIDTRTTNITVGINSHLGPVEADFSHSEKRFDSGRDSAMSGSYTAFTSGSPAVVRRAAGDYFHNLIPDLKGSSNALKLHTSFSGGFTAAATVSRTERKNEDSGAKATYFTGTGDLTWTASPQVAVFLKYRHKKADIDSPSSVTVTALDNPLNTYIYTKPGGAVPYSTIKDSISSISDNLTATVRYRIVTGLTIRGEYTFEDVRRKSADEWGLPDSTKRNIASLSADIRLFKTLSIKTKYTHKEIARPEFNVEPENADEGRVSLVWTPLTRVSALVSYIVGREKSDSVFIDFDPKAQAAPTNRDVKKDRLLGSVTVMPLKNLSCTASYSYMHDVIKQDIAVSSITDVAVPNKMLSHSYALDVVYMPSDRISLRGGAGITTSNGKFFTHDVNLSAPDDIALFSELKARETSYTAAADYRFSGGYAAGFQYKYSGLRDLINNPYDDINNGTAHLILLTLSKRW